ncbi:MAG: hypothetical protein Q9217_005415, partial [Psora testacea]
TKELTHHTAQTEFTESLFLQEGQEAHIEGIPIDRVIAHGDIDLHHSMIVPHSQLDRSATNGKHGPVVADGIQAAAGISGGGICFETAGGRGQESEVGCGEKGKEGECYGA